MKHFRWVAVILKGILGLLSLLILAFFISAYGLYQTKIKTAPLISENGWIYLAIFGKGGKNHTAPDLTDTIILAALNPSEAQVKLISLPRDLWDEELRIKINSAYYWGKQYYGKGLPAAIDEITKITGRPVRYGVVVDFDLFKRVVDDLGGVWVNVERGFDDYFYPIPGKEDAYPISSRYQHISFKPGLQWMSGERALMFVRSRHAQGEEGSDFARSRRQQLVIRAIINQVLDQKVKFLSHPKDTLKTTRGWLELIETNLGPNQMINLGFSLAQSQIKGKTIKIKSLSFDKDSPEIKADRVQVNRDRIWVLVPDLPRLRQKIESFILADN